MLLQVTALVSFIGLALCGIPAGLPAFCHDLDCPQYTVLETTADYELRRYNETKWVSVQAMGPTRDAVNSDMFQTLFKYIDGTNANNVKIPMTAPVLMKVEHGQGPNCASNFTMHFMLPHDDWTSPIKPSNPNVYINTLPPMEVYVAEFSGWANDKDYQDHIMSLYNSLEAKSLNVDTTFYFDAGYDGPYQFAHRHNEVWIAKL